MQNWGPLMTDYALRREPVSGITLYARICAAAVRYPNYGMHAEGAIA